MLFFAFSIYCPVKDSQISCSLNLPTQINFEKRFFQKKLKIQVFRSLRHWTSQHTYWYIDFNGNYFSLTNNFSSLIAKNILITNLDNYVVDLFLGYVDKSYFIYHSFSREFCMATITVFGVKCGPSVSLYSTHDS